MKKLLTLFVILSVAITVKSQTTTSYGTGAGSSGSYNSMFGYFTGNATTANNNTMVGYRAGNSNSSGERNTFIGSTAGYYSTTGSYNIFQGARSGYINKTGDHNIFIGVDAGYRNEHADQNICIGNAAGMDNFSSYNVIIGSWAGRNSNGKENVFLGRRAGYATKTSYNTMIGSNAGKSNQTGADNTYIGYLSGYSSLSGSNNTFVGSQSGRLNGGGSNNSFLGNFAGYDNQNGSGNTYVGYESGRFNKGGFNNTFLGEKTGKSNLYGDYNTFLGSYAGSESSGSNNTFVGNFSGQANNGSGNVFIGYSAGWDLLGSNQLLVGNDTASNLIFGNFTENHVAIGTIPSVSYQKDYTLYVQGYAYATGYWKSSDKRYKEQVKSIASPLAKIRRINGRQYKYKSIQGKQFPEGRQLGFIAQDLRKVLPEAVLKHEDGTYSVDYSMVIPVLVEALKEVSIKNEALEQKITLLEDKLYTNDNPSFEELGTGKNLLKSIPNPGVGSSVIHFNNNVGTESLQIIIFDLNGKTIKAYDQLPSNGMLEVTTSEIGTGMFNYALIAKGEIIATSKMILN